MRFFAVAAAVLGLAVAFSSPVGAWWNFAKWDLTLEDLQRESGGKLEPCRSQCRTPISGFNPTHRMRDIQAAGYTGDAWFSFDASGHLNWTVLTFDDETAFGAIERALIEVYGAPIDKVRTSVKATTWRDGAKRTTIRIVDFGGKLAGTFVEYRPVANGL